MLRRTKENFIASILDIASMMFAYELGVSQLGLLAGIFYGVFDAWLVIWQRDRIIDALRIASDKIREQQMFRRKDILPWAAD